MICALAAVCKRRVESNIDNAGDRAVVLDFQRFSTAISTFIHPFWT
jgi:hypothetical protein